jgi:hypothetical protein
MDRPPRWPTPDPEIEPDAETDAETDADPADAAASTAPAAPCAPASPGALEPIIGGTLALLTFYARTPHLVAADKIARNLALIARHPQASEALQTVCTRLFLDWLGPCRTSDEPTERQWRTVFAPPGGLQ